MAVSIKDVASRAGVSIATVSRVLNGTASVKPEKAQAVREALEYYQYQPNQFGRGLVKQQSGMVGVYLPVYNRSMFNSTYYLELLRGIEQKLSDTEYHMVLISNPITGANDTRLWPLLQQKRIGGLILSGPYPYRQQATEMTEAPVVYIGKREHMTGDNIYARYQMYITDMLIRLYQAGHRKILLYMSSLHDRYWQEIQATVKARYPKMQLFVRLMGGQSDDAPQSITEDLQEYCLRLGCTAVCTGEVASANVLIGACAQLGISIPGDLSVLTAEHQPGEAAGLYPPISAYLVPAFEMGKAAAELVLQRIQQKDGEPGYVSREFSPQFVDRGSVRALSET